MDDVYIAGVKLIYMGEFLAVNQPGKYTAKLPKYICNLRT
jgi:hypothetical protein